MCNNSSLNTSTQSTLSEKLNLYREIIEIDPSSRVFFLYAQLLEKEEQIDEALNVLAKGLERQPDYLEARLYYIDLLSKHDKIESAQIQLYQFTDILKKYPAFWATWSKLIAEENSTISSTLALLSTFFSNPSLTLMEVLQAGIYHYSENLSFYPPIAQVAANPVVTMASPLAAAEQVPEVEMQPSHYEAEQEEASSLSFENNDDKNERKAKTSTHTRSMADLLAEQGDIEGSLEIYTELLECADDDIHKQELLNRIHQLEEQKSSPKQEIDSAETKEDIQPTIEAKAKEKSDALSPKMLDMLENLAVRLESRVITS